MVRSDKESDSDPRCNAYSFIGGQGLEGIEWVRGIMRM